VPTDEASRTVTVAAPIDTVLATVRDIASEPEWVAEIRTVDILESDADGRPLQAHLTASAPVGTDEYTLAYTHRDDGLSWSLVSGKLQTGQDASYTLRAVDDAHTEVTFDLKISHNLPLPGFLRRKVIGDLASNRVKGLTKRVESA
jgi:uncharacterized membrane protein